MKSCKKMKARKARKTLNKSGPVRPVRSKGTKARRHVGIYAREARMAQRNARHVI